MACLFPGVRWPVPQADNGSTVYIGGSYRAKVINGGVLAFGENAELLAAALGKPLSDLTQVPCGKCINCRIRFRKEWALRLSKEAELYSPTSVLFLTLTYSDPNLPLALACAPSSVSGEIELAETGTLRASDPLLFFKRLRRWYEYNWAKVYGSDAPCPKLRQYHCGEYGTETDRPHYHAILFGLDLSFLATVSKVIKNEPRKFLMRCPALEEIWGKGYVALALANFECMQYVAGYVVKKKFGKEKYVDSEMYWTLTDDSFTGNPLCPDGMLHPAFEGFRDTVRLKRPPELRELPFAHGSNRPGIARGWYELHKEEIYSQDEMYIVNKTGTHRIKPVSYFDRLYDLENHPRLEELKTKRRSRSVTLHGLKLDKLKMSDKQYKELQIQRSERTLPSLLQYRKEL